MEDSKHDPGTPRAAPPASDSDVPAPPASRPANDDGEPPSGRVAVAVAAAASPSPLSRKPKPVRVPAPRVTPAELRAFVGQKDTLERVRRVVMARVAESTPKHVVDEIVSDAYTAALEAKSPPRSRATMPGWLATITARKVATHFRRDAAHLRWLNRDADVEQEAGEPQEESPDDEWLLSHWLAKQVAGNETEQETLELLAYKVQHDKSDDQVAADHGMSTSAFRVRVHRLKKKYAPRWQRRERTILLLWLAAALFVVAALAFVFRRIAPPESVAPAVSAQPESASASASAEPSPPAPSGTHLDQALPPPRNPNQPQPPIK